jgi:hypothetical protein
MCERISFIATTEGSLQIYACPGLDSHGSARAGWGITGGAECEWTGETYDSLTVRYEDRAMATTIRHMIVEKYPTRADLLATIFETRGFGGERMFYPTTEAQLAEMILREKFPNIGLVNFQQDTDLLRECGNADLRGYAHELPMLANKR